MKKVILAVLSLSLCFSAFAKNYKYNLFDDEGGRMDLIIEKTKKDDNSSEKFVIDLPTEYVYSKSLGNSIPEGKYFMSSLNSLRLVEQKIIDSSTGKDVVVGRVNEETKKADLCSGRYTDKCTLRFSRRMFNLFTVQIN